jgi:hypothetical protein
MPLFLLLIFIALIFVANFYKAKIKGAIGEQTVALYLHALDKKKYKVLHNVVLESDGYTTQIDHIVISDYGVFVIETKNYKGWIFGNEEAQYWTQVIFNHREKLYNPIKQNQGHIKALKKCLPEFPNLIYTSIIAFSSRATLKVHTTTKVVYTARLTRTIKRYSVNNLSATEKESIVEKIKAANSITTFDKRKHIESIQHRIAKREHSIREEKCPKCGNSLVKRQGKFSTFLGCTSYPKCTHTIKLEKY